MANRMKVRVAAIVWCLAVSLDVTLAQKTENAAATTDTTIHWRDCLKQKPDWYASDEAIRIADNVLLYQRETGGWHKNIDMAQRLTEQEQNEISKQKKEDDSTIDNGATYTQLQYLARVYTANKLARHKAAFLTGVDYLLKAQYPNGGWPQYYPRLTGYYKHITFNDDAMIGVMKLLNDIAKKKADYTFIDEDRRLKAEKAVKKGIEVILKTQVIVDGKRTVWGAQHDEVTLAPAAARKFEPVSLCSRESVGIVRFLMSIDKPDARVSEAIEGAITWFEKTKISGLSWTPQRDTTSGRGFSHVLVKDPQASPIWARFYEIGTDRPIFAGRDASIRYSVTEIEEERREGYAWYGSEPVKLLNEDYPAWKKRRH
jgi:PelA/Pel-15E family pectate lyase